MTSAAEARPGGPVLQDAASLKDWRLLTAATAAFGLGFGIYLGTAPGFAVQHLRIEPEQLGLLESLREVPGLLIAGIVGLLAFLPEVRLASLALLVMGAGFALTGQVGQYWPLVACNLLFSAGLHLWLSVQPAVALSLSRPGHTGQSLSLMNRTAAFAMMAGLLFVRLLAGRLGFGLTFFCAGAAAAAGFFFVSRILPHRGGGLEQRVVFRRKYWRYYLLMLLDGGRRQVVQTFAVLILLREFGVSFQTAAGLQLLNALLTMAAAPLVGRWTDRFGERSVLLCYYALVALIFFSYTRISAISQATGAAPLLLFTIIFAIDNTLFTASVGIQSYIRHTATPADLSASLAMGLTWNHVAAVSVPLAAGWIWAHYGYEKIFLWGIALALLSLVTCLVLPKMKQHDPAIMEIPLQQAETGAQS